MAGLFALSGGLTNWLAIHMLFEKVPLLYGSGVIPNRFEDFKNGIKNLIMNEFFSSIILNSQNRKPIKGQLLYKNTKVVAANVVNNTSQMNTITDSDGFFEIDVALRDEIIFSSVQYRIRSVIITEEIIKKNRLVVSVNENINELKEVVVTTEDVEKFLDLKEEEFKGFDYEEDKSSKLENRAVLNRQLSNGIDFVKYS